MSGRDRCRKCDGDGEFTPNVGALWGGGTVVCDVCGGEGRVQ